MLGVRAREQGQVIAVVRNMLNKADLCQRTSHEVESSTKQKIHSA